MSCHPMSPDLILLWISVPQSNSVLFSSSNGIVVWRRTSIWDDPCTVGASTSGEICTWSKRVCKAVRPVASIWKSTPSSTPP
ncbi:hypothetical protein BDP55DRAFT_675348 [Colletotrichum godetiae]|uniref:Uncharacterized protein n=1 Tax=Colletotrichum godetiae TaxID=1209918 RepID=A0AAJ0AD67_9PEZI|nr:uncharacterized protein BDP55DRAFT_675348 [Colletotrichum godetiae]KAK1671763.1 hypothetical protein BDP55DRAFT_675348 [Colletotrichum godetiae]